MKFHNDMNLFIGAPGCGKTCLCAKITKNAVKQGIPVYSNVFIQGAYELNPKEDIGVYMMRDCVIIIDEIGTIYNNRNWKTNVSDKMLAYLKRFRHYNATIFCFSQGLDFDNRFIGLATHVYIVQKSMLNIIGIPLSKYKLITKHVGVDENTGQLVDKYVEAMSTHWYLRPLYYKMFDSFEIDDLPEKEWKLYQ